MAADGLAHSTSLGELMANQQSNSPNAIGGPALAQYNSNASIGAIPEVAQGAQSRELGNVNQEEEN